MRTSFLAKLGHRAAARLHRALGAEPPAAAGAEEARLQLTVKDERGTRRYTLPRGQIVIGSGDGVDVRLSAAGVEAQHCLLRAEGQQVVLLDLGAGSTEVGGRAVARASLEAGSVVRLGGALVRVDAATAPAAQKPVIDGRGRGDFREAVRSSLERMTWYSLALLAHGLILLVLSLIPLAQSEVSPSRLMVSTLPLDHPGAQVEPAKAPEVVEQRQADPDPPVVQEAEPADAQDSGFDLSTVDGVGAPEGPDAPAEAGGVPSVGIRGFHPLPRPDGGGGGNGGDANQRARNAVERGMGGSLRALRGLPARSIVVAKGQYDAMQDVLQLYGIPHTLIRRAQLEEYPLSQCRILCINCGLTVSGGRASKMVARVKDFVKRGGWLMTSDWAIDPFLSEAYPDQVKLVPPLRRQPDDTVTIEATAAGRSDPLLQGVLAGEETAKWWLENTSDFFDVYGNARVLVESRDMEARYGTKVVVFELFPGKGRILHLLGHFHQQQTNYSGLVAMQRLILNFVRERFHAPANR